MDGSGRKVLLTGASGGIGRAIAHQLADTGARLLLSARDAIRLAELARELPQDTVTVVADITSTIDRAALVQAAHEMGIDMVIHNAGVQEFGLFQQQDPGVLQQQLELNLCAPMLLSRELLRLRWCSSDLLSAASDTPALPRIAPASSGCVVWQSACGESWLIPVYVCITWHRARPALR